MKPNHKKKKKQKTNQNGKKFVKIDENIDKK